MALLSEVSGNTLLIRSVGDHGLEEGFLQLLEAMDLSLRSFDATGVKNNMYLDMLDSNESKDSEDMRHIVDFFSQHLNHLSGKMAILVKEEWHFGMSRLFSSMAGLKGLDVKVSYNEDELKEWLRAH